jgi:hypothetical protein
VVTPRTSLASARLNRAQPGNQGVKLTKSKMKERCRYVPSRAELVSCVVTGRVSSTAHHAPAFRFRPEVRTDCLVRGCFDFALSSPPARPREPAPARGPARASELGGSRLCRVWSVSVPSAVCATANGANVRDKKGAGGPARGLDPCEVSATYGTCVSEVEK